jgi:hypothetical protein
MPVIKVWCLSPMRDMEDKLRKLYEAIVAAVVEIPELGLKDGRDMTVLFPSDMMQFGLGKDIVVEVDGLFVKPERTREVRQALALSLVDTIWNWDRTQTIQNVECFVRSFDPAKEGFATRKTRTGL